MFNTIRYRGHYIHTAHDRTGERVTWQHARTYEVRPVKSYRAAQIAIARTVKAKGGGNG